MRDDGAEGGVFAAAGLIGLVLLAEAEGDGGISGVVGLSISMISSASIALGFLSTLRLLAGELSRESLGFRACLEGSGVRCTTLPNVGDQTKWCRKDASATKARGKYSDGIPPFTEKHGQQTNTAHDWVPNSPLTLPIHCQNDSFQTLVVSNILKASNPFLRGFDANA